MKFTSEHYGTLISAAAKKFRFVRFGDDLDPTSAVALWRHDIDFSPQRALVMAQQEAGLELRATYFVQVSARYYSVFEPETAKVIRTIRELGHEIGLHFDPEVCYDQATPTFEERLRFEAEVLGQITGSAIRIFSLHNPTTIVGAALDEPFHSGLMNASASALRSSFTYCSDSNGLWRFRPLDEVVADPEVTRLYTLTHPEWWQENEMPPRDRIRRCIEGRAEFCIRHYDDLLSANSRPNVRSFAELESSD